MTAVANKKRSVRLPRERRMADIMAAAREIFCDKGYGDASITEIAARAQVVEGTIYTYFENKQDLLVKVLEQWYEGMLSDYDQHVAGIAGTRNRLRYMIWRHLKTVHSEPRLCRLVFREIRTSADYHHSPIFQLNKKYTDLTMQIVEEGIESGEFPSDIPVKLVRDMVYGGIEHHTWNYVEGDGDFDVDRIADTITDIIYRGISSTSQRPKEETPVTRLDGLAARLENIAEALEASTG